MIRLAAIIALVFLARMCLAADPAPSPESSLTRGLGFLTRQQNRDGSFGADTGRALPTSRAIVIFLQLGNTPDSGRYGSAVKSAESWMLTSILPSGGFAGSEGRTRAQAMALLAMSQTYGVESNPERKGRLLTAMTSAVGPLLALQVPVQTPARADAGGWGDEKNAAANVQLTATAAIALSAARDAGIAVPSPVFEQARRYLLACFQSASGGFCEELGKPASIDATAAALVTLDVLAPAGDDVDRLAPAVTKYMESQATAAATSITFSGGAWLCWCDARLQIPAVEKLREEYVQQLVATQGQDNAWISRSAKSDAVAASRLPVTELALLGLTAHFRFTPVLRR